VISNKIEEALANYWGRPCATYEFDCAVCKAWDEYRLLVEAAMRGNARG
jgi:hypothetical protein